MVYDLGLEGLYQKITQPKETNTQIGPLFSQWIRQKRFNCAYTNDEEQFIAAEGNVVFTGSDQRIAGFAKQELRYKSSGKGLDFLGKFNGKYVLGEAKFISAEGGNQRNQIARTRQFLDDTEIKAIKVAIFDGIIYLPKHQNLLRLIGDEYLNHPVFSALLLEDFLNSI